MVPDAAKALRPTQETVGPSRISNESRLSNLERLVLVGTVALAASVQIQTTVSITGSAVRVSLSDIVALVLFPLLVIVAAKHWRQSGPKVGATVILFGAMATVAIGYGLAIGTARLGMMEIWPLVKAVGWLSLLYYGLLGLACALVFPRLANTAFAAAFLGFAALLLVIHTVFFAMATDWVGSYAYRYQGVLDNPNAQGFVLLCGFAICLAGQGQLGRWLGDRWSEVATGFLLAGVFHSSSLAAVGAAVCMILVHLKLRAPSLWQIARVIAFAGAILSIAIVSRTIVVDTKIRTGFHDLSDKVGWLVASTEDETRNTPQADPLEARDFSINVRIESYYRALENWADAPVFGTGLGSHLQAKQTGVKDNAPAQQIHNTGLWILTELGLVGFTAFLGLFVTLIWRFWKTSVSARNSDTQSADAVYAVVLVMSGWLVMSLAHELLYQRALWLMMGLALGTCIRFEQQAQAAVRASQASDNRSGTVIDARSTQPRPESQETDLAA